MKTPDPSVMTTDPNTGALKELKADRWDLMPWGALEQVALVYGKSAEEHGGKYPARNWEKGYAWGKSFRALIGHVAKPMRGEWYDPESGLPHLAHAAWHCLTLMVYFDKGLGTDDRSKLPEKLPGYPKVDGEKYPLTRMAELRDEGVTRPPIMGRVQCEDAKEAAQVPWRAMDRG